MNTCIRATFECSWEKIEERILQDMKSEAGKFVSDYTLVREGEKGLIWLGNVTDLEAFGAFMNTPEQQRIDEEDGVSVLVYTMQSMEE
ncbi:MAG: hypothetical protein AAEJ57_03405 [Opitutales bacterium]